MTMKTPEQMAEEYVLKHYGYSAINHQLDFLAGYQAAKDTYKDAIDTYEDVAKQMLEEAVRIMSPKDQLADADKVMEFNKGNNAEMEKVNMKFAYDSFPVTVEQAQNVKQIRETFSSLADLLSQLVPNGRYLSIVNTKLEEACMFAIKGVTHQAGDYDKLQYKA